MAPSRAERIARLIEPLRVKPGSAVDLGRDFSPRYKANLKKKDSAALLGVGVELLAEYQERLAAQDTYGVLLCLQALDAGGKDGTIRHVMSGVNPQGVKVSSFKVPSAEELDHDYLWRYAQRLPARGDIAIFNRSHYEEVLVVRVHSEALDRQRLPDSVRTETIWDRRYREINNWERYLTDNGFRIVKVFLNLSKEEQRIRFMKRIDLPEKNWKFSAADVRERRRWDDYQVAFSEMLSATSTRDIGVVGRVAPEHKVLLADLLKKQGHVVAMTGDGVNDAPAIKAADIGIAMGSGTDVAKNAGRMILSDDNFATIVYAVEQGRKIYDNLTKYIRFVLLLLVTFVLTFLGATLFNIAAGEPFTPPQVLWIHFVVNASFGFALGFDRESAGLMQRRPRPRGESVLTRPVLVTVGLAGLAITVILLGLIKLGESWYGSAAIGNSTAFTAFALCLVVAAFECRSETDSVLTPATFDSKQMNWVALGQIVLAVLVTQMDAFRRILGTTEINLRQFGWALLSALVLLALWECGKLLARRSASS
jgi:PPK2 family polyphosphate:nucleotide phosphotransferase